MNLTMTTTLAVLAKYNKNRGVISWIFGVTANGSYQSIRNDGRVYRVNSIEELRQGYAKLRDEYGFIALSA